MIELIGDSLMKSLDMLKLIKIKKEKADEQEAPVQKSQDRLEVLKKIEMLEQEGKFDRYKKSCNVSYTDGTKYELYKLLIRFFLIK